MPIFIFPIISQWKLAIAMKVKRKMAIKYIIFVEANVMNISAFSLIPLRPIFLLKLIYKPADCNFRKSGKKIKYHSDGYIFIFSAAYFDIHFA